MPGRFDHFPKFELNILWQSLYDYRQKMIDEEGVEFNYNADDTTKLIDEIYKAPNWCERAEPNLVRPDV
jgi:hypothetical protein